MTFSNDVEAHATAAHPEDFDVQQSSRDGKTEASQPSIPILSGSQSGDLAGRLFQLGADHFLELGRRHYDDNTSQVGIENLLAHLGWTRPPGPPQTPPDTPDPS